MNRLNLLFGPTMILCLMGCSGSAQIMNKSSSHILERRFRDFTSVGHEFISLCMAAEIPCGVQEAAGEEEYAAYNEIEPKLRVPKNASVADILGMIVQRQPKYRWSVANGVVNLLPRSEYLPLESGQNVLHRKIPHLKFSNTSSRVVMNEICAAGGIRNPPKRFIGVCQAPKLISLDITNATVEQAFNAAARADGKMFWYFRATDKPGEYSLDMQFWRRCP